MGDHAILVGEARRLVEVEGVDAVVGPVGEGVVVREVARTHPDVIFMPIWSGP